MKDAIRAHAHQIGFDLVGFAAADPMPELLPILQERRQKGFQSELEPVAEQRVDPQAWLPGCRSVIVCGLAYRGREEPQPPPGLRGWVSRYCYGQDYHRVMHRKLSRLAQCIEAQAPGTACKAFVDTGPAVDRHWAVRAGLGFYGKSSMLITRQHGTWVFLGLLLTTLALAPDAPVSGTCGTCTRCLDICPTGAIVAPGVIDASRCISELSQRGGFVPRHLRAAFGNRVFGCDDCQDVCPFNLGPIAHGDHPEFRPDPELAFPDLERLYRMTIGKFTRWYKPGAAGWKGKMILQRNAVIAMGNSGDPRAVPVLLEALGDSRPVIRGHAAWALGRFLPDAKIAQALLTRRMREVDDRVREEIDLVLEVNE